MPRGKGPGLLRGLDPVKNIIADETTDSVEVPEDDREEVKLARRRASRGSKQDVNYDMKFHPMDLVTRPNRPATQRHRSKFVSFAASTDAEDDGDSDEASSESESESSLDELSSDSPHYQVTSLPMPRTPDPRAVRSSLRAQAQKPINYSKKFHPQDWALPGHRRKAMLKPSIPQPASYPQKRKVQLPTPPDDDHDESSASERGSAVPPANAHKKSRTVDRNESSSTRAAPKTANKARMLATAKTATRSSDSTGNIETDHLVPTAISASQPPGKLKTTHGEPMSSDSNEDDIVAAATAASQPPGKPRASHDERKSRDSTEDGVVTAALAASRLPRESTVINSDNSSDETNEADPNVEAISASQPPRKSTMINSDRTFDEMEEAGPDMERRSASRPPLDITKNEDGYRSGGLSSDNIQKSDIDEDELEATVMSLTRALTQQPSMQDGDAYPPSIECRGPDGNAVEHPSEFDVQFEITMTPDRTAEIRINPVNAATGYSNEILGGERHTTYSDDLLASEGA